MGGVCVALSTGVYFALIDVFFWKTFSSFFFLFSWTREDLWRYFAGRLLGASLFLPQDTKAYH